MTVSTVYSGTADGYLHATGITANGYSVLRAGTGTITPNALGANTAATGQEHSTTYDVYGFYEAFIGFDINSLSITAGSSIDSVVLSLYAATLAVTASPTIVWQARTHVDWGTLTSADFVPGADLSAKTLLATRSETGMSTSAYNDYTESGTNFKSAITTALTSTLYMILDSERMVSGDAPASNTTEYFVFNTADNSGTTTDPKLVITWTPHTLKTINGLARASVKTINGLALASVKTWNGLT